MLPSLLPPAALACLYLRAARRLEAEARDLADLATYGQGASRRTLRRQAAAHAADARALRNLARLARAESRARRGPHPAPSPG